MKDFLLPRIIGSHRATVSGGPLVILLGGVHGNELAGVAALQELADRLAHTPELRAALPPHLSLLALRGNTAALAEGVRYIDQDLNRLWFDEHIDEWQTRPPVQPSEAEELLDILRIVHETVTATNPDRIIFIDLHTTTASGGCFWLCDESPANLGIARATGLPLIRGLTHGLRGTTLNYFRPGRFGARAVRALTFETGPHAGPHSPDRLLAAVFTLLHSLGCLDTSALPIDFAASLIPATVGVPRETRLRYVHRIEPTDGFVMHPGYQNFSPVSAGQPVANDHWGTVHVPVAGYLLMPLYQRQGSEGFFLVSA